jgi:hypothetical protein
MRQARDSLEELLDDLNICLDESYFDARTIQVLRAEGLGVLHRINSYVCYLRHRKLGGNSLAEQPPN